MSLLDIAPTVLDVVGAAPPPGLEGVSLASGAPPGDRTLYSEYYRPLVHIGLLGRFIKERSRIECLANRRLVAVRAGDRKIIVSSDGQEHLYDFAMDPVEASPMPAEAAPPQLLHQARNRLTEMASRPTLPSPELGRAQRQALRALGVSAVAGEVSGGNRRAELQTVAPPGFCDPADPFPGLSGLVQ